MQLYQFVWLVLFSYMGYKGFQSLLGKGTFFGGLYDYTFDDFDDSNSQSVKSNAVKSKNSYLVLIGNDNNKYTYFYQPEAVIFSFGGSRRNIFERTLLSLNTEIIVTVAASETMKKNIMADINAKNTSDRWLVLQSTSVKKNRNYRGEIKKLQIRIQNALSRPIALPSTIIFDLAAEYLKFVIQRYSKACSQFIIYNRKRVMTNLKSINMMMGRAGYRYVSKTKSHYIATYVSKKSSLWKSK